MRFYLLGHNTGLAISGIFTCLALIATAQKDGVRPYVSEVWVADQGDGSYVNPILYADYSDPDVVRIGSDYYMTASSFNCAPGLPILHSTDLVNWKLINHALERQVPEDFFSKPQHGNGVWAPCMREHDGEIYIYWGDPDHGVYMVKTSDPQGEWEPPVLVLAGKGIIDPSPLWDDDGRVYLIHAWAGSRAGVNSLLTVREMNVGGFMVIGDPVHVFDGHDAHKTIEGPKFLKRNGYYYILAPAGGVSGGWQLALRSEDIYGPYEVKVVLERGSTDVNGPHQGALLETPFGESWFIHFQDREAYGRITHLQPVHWVNGWPLMGIDHDGNGIGEPVKRHEKPEIGRRPYTLQTPVESDEFNADELGLQWQWHANPDVVWSALIRNTGFLRLFAINRNADDPNMWNVPNLLLQKFPAPDFKAVTRVEWNVEFDAWQSKKAGLIVMGDDYAYLSISRDAAGYRVDQIVCQNAASGTPERVVASALVPSKDVYLSVRVQGPDGDCIFSYSLDGEKFEDIGETFRAKPDKWIGAKVGIFCISKDPTRRGSYADFDWFRITK